MNWAICLWFLLQAFGLGISLAKHGETQKINFFITLLASIVSIGLLYLGGAFNNF